MPCTDDGRSDNDNCGPSMTVIWWQETKVHEITRSAKIEGSKYRPRLAHERMKGCDYLAIG